MQFNDLVFKPHKDGRPGHWHALHPLPSGKKISVTRWNHEYHGSDAERPSEVVLPGGGLLEYQTTSDIDELLRRADMVVAT